MTDVAAPGAGPRSGSAVARRGGVLPLDKPAGITSFDAIRQVRRILGERRVGHAGTLDPDGDRVCSRSASGADTRFVDYFHAQPKTYHCVVRLGERSDTCDTEGVVVTGADAERADGRSDPVGAHPLHRRDRPGSPDALGGQARGQAPLRARASRGGGRSRDLAG